MAVWSSFRVTDGDGDDDSFTVVTGLGCGLPVVQEVESSLQDVAACVVLTKSGAGGQTILPSLFFPITTGGAGSLGGQNAGGEHFIHSAAH